MNKEYIYLDYAANTPVQKEVLDTFNDVTQQYFANPNSTHNLGKETNSKIVQTTENILKLLKDETNINEESEIVYTSGSSESNNLAIKGVAKSYKENGKHIISTFLEHSSVSSPLTYLKEEGYEKTMVSMQGIGYRQVFEYLEGNLSLEDTIEQIKKDTRHFAKRQLTWFGREKEVCMVDKSQFGSEDEILTYMLTILKEKGIYDGSVKELL